MKRPFEIASEIFPFESRWKKIKDINIHYIDEGEGPVILFCHGNPTYSLLYSNIISKLRDKYRCIAMDYPGFGMSGKPEYPGYGYTPEEHSEILKEFILKMKLEDFSIFVQDWGGPIGLNAACDLSERIKYLFIGNTWAWEFKEGTPSGESARGFSNKMGGDDLKEKIMQKNSFMNISISLLLRGIKKRNPEQAEKLKEAYVAPFNTPESRIPTWVFPRRIIESGKFLDELSKKLPRIINKKAILFWGEKDVIFPAPVKEEWKRILKNFTEVSLPEASHFFQEEEPDQIAQEIVNLYNS
jgi:haloalkane dehalogenase